VAIDSYMYSVQYTLSVLNGASAANEAKNNWKINRYKH